MKVFRLTLAWSVALFALSLIASTLPPFGLYAETHVGGATIYPTFRFFRGGLQSKVTESTLERVFHDRLAGAFDRKGLAKRLASHLYALCSEHQLDPAFVLSVIQVESNFRTDVVSPAGAIGLMQMMPETARVVGGQIAEFGNRISKNPRLALTDPFLNLTLGVIYLKQLKDRYAGLSPYYPLAAYNMGPYRLDTLRANPSFKPEKTLKYYKDIMRGVGDWRHYKSRLAGPRKGSIQSRQTGLKPILDVVAEPTLRKI